MPVNRRQLMQTLIISNLVLMFGFQDAKPLCDVMLGSPIAGLRDTTDGRSGIGRRIQDGGLGESRNGKKLYSHVVSSPDWWPFFFSSSPP